MFSHILRFLPFSLVAVVSSLLTGGCSTINDIRYGVTYEKNYPVATKNTTPHRSGGVYHSLREGETLYRVAKTYGVNQNELMRINRIADPTEIPVGKSLWIPGAPHVKNVPSASPNTQYASLTPSSSERPTSAISRTTNHTKDIDTPDFSSKDYLWPVEGGVITSRYGLRHNKKHDGLDIGAPLGRKIYSAQGGMILFSGYGPTGYGKLVIVKHNSRIISVYAHCSQLLVRKGQRVTKGQVIAKVGSTGRSTGPHLHFEVRVDRKPVNPLKYIPDQPSSSRRYARN